MIKFDDLYLDMNHPADCEGGEA